jgi:hypothetical protein
VSGATLAFWMCLIIDCSVWAVRCPIPTTKRETEMRANKVFEFYRPDEIAECWEGIPRDLYVRLWDLVDRYEKRSANIEDMCMTRSVTTALRSSGSSLAQKIKPR